MATVQIAKIHPDMAVDMCDAATVYLDTGSTLVIYEGTIPTLITDAITTQEVLIEYNLPAAPVFAGAVPTTAGGTATANAITTVEAAADGTAQFFRAYDSGDVCRIQGTVTDPAGSGDLKISTTAVTNGIAVEVVSWTVTVPKG
jgi:hypothetical protein